MCPPPVWTQAGLGFVSPLPSPHSGNEVAHTATFAAVTPWAVPPFQARLGGIDCVPQGHLTAVNPKLEARAPFLIPASMREIASVWVMGHGTDGTHFKKWVRVSFVY
eukprot:scaffold6759_cov52-Cyclotella_meneghiniana.AAC.2